MLAACGTGALWWLLRPFRVEVEGPSMEPTLLPGEWAIAIRARRVRAGDVVVVAHPHRPEVELVKRVVAANGGRLRIAGDNPARSTDSRDFGDVAEANVGRVVVVYWPPGRIRSIRRRTNRSRP